MKNVGILTGGGDAPGLNAVIRAVVIRLARQSKDYNVVGLIDGWAGLRDKTTRPLTKENVDQILHEGGTVLGTSRTNLYKKGKEDELKKAIENYSQLGLD